MVSPSALASIAVQLVTVGAATYATVQCLRLQRFGADRRLTILAWFFGLFAASVAFQAAWQYQISDPFDASFRVFREGGPGPGNATGNESADFTPRRVGKRSGRAA